ncbi:MAG TPA: thiopeptide-type bacteriocin biosynthesis protein [Candidatus Polarisedimenticolaceae bacterium]|nr:thiopeptide-type bacteriocin biosynthesis protein [Candidatus Polarisedimenticolaceae bacterium]
MLSPRSLEVWLHAPREEHDPLVRELIAPLSAEISAEPSLAALFFGRYNKPDWHLRLRVLGEAEWLEGALRPRLERALGRERERGGLRGFEYAEYERELERYGGEEGLGLAERVFHYDTRACLELLDAEQRGLCAKTRREHCLLTTERYLDLLDFTRDERLTFYRYAYSFEIDLGRWGDEEQQALEQHYRGIKDGLLALLRGETRDDGERSWGGTEPARIATEYLAAIAPLLGKLRAGQAAGRIRRGRVDLAWALTHMHCNRLQVEADAEAILRFFMHRLHAEEELA